MFSKILLVLGVVLVISALGSALECNVCDYWTSQPKEQQKCTSRTVTCSFGFDYCYTLSGTYQNGTDVVERSCSGNSVACHNTEATCFILAIKYGLKSCAFECCNTDNCNNYTPSRETGINYTPSSATGVMMTKFTLSMMVIVGLIFA
ncbi:Hypothetical predicted protein [Paramuricea clavata]|uniref:Uncharacterized protein n=1 Tax=Paramuricea clavata TaxID=317549 RepID=A0A7D9IBT0_PARCT|nr:Hypothetical predicted protein [Paramuricea clavata]